MQETLTWLSAHKEDISISVTVLVLVCRAIEMYLNILQRAKNESRINLWCAKNYRLAFCWKWATRIYNTKRHCANCDHNRCNGADICVMCDLECSVKLAEKQSKQAND